MPGYRWVNRTGSQSLPQNAVVGGRDSDGSTIYVGRAYHEGDMLPAKVIPDKNVAYVCHNGEEHPKDEFEILCQSEVAWQFCSNGEVPADAVIGGQTTDGEPLYVGRVLHSGAQTIGKVQQSHGCLYIPFDGEELSFKDYEVLVIH
ncbi:natterin-3-like [Pseudomyrmex gracilis]|uniref:natterin-3-like n=1 Tax=Pseudomyrmex gracilis TaxID=219809 RepID=UPI000995B471|nr:natterin-3-like [Pseudomyrmex gracilis]